MHTKLTVPGEGGDIEVAVRPLALADYQRMVSLKLKAIYAGEGLKAFSDPELMRAPFIWPGVYQSQLLMGQELTRQEQLRRVAMRQEYGATLRAEEIPPGWGWAVQDAAGTLLAFAFVQETAVQVEVAQLDLGEAEVLMRHFPWHWQDLYVVLGLPPELRQRLAMELASQVFASMDEMRVGLYMWLPRATWLSKLLNQKTTPVCHQINIIDLLPQRMAYFWRGAPPAEPLKDQPLEKHRAAFLALWPKPDLPDLPAADMTWAEGFWTGPPRHVHRMLSARGEQP